jgi:iron complex transport system substrate-binding protein
VVQIAERLDLDLVGIPQSSSATTPARYLGATDVGAPMQPDLEIVRSVNPDFVLSPITLEADLKPQYEAAGLKSYFVDLTTVEGMYASIEELGRMFDRQAEAQVLLDEYQEFLERYQAETHNSHPRVLLLMGLPGSYVVATEHSYAGSLVKMAGGINVYADAPEDFITANTEDMVSRDPDIILRTAHALPDQVMEMFADEFATNDTWRHFRAVQEDRVYDLPAKTFGMSATFDYPEALVFLDTILWNMTERLW